MLDNSTISLIKERLANKFNLQRIILFGFHARNDADDKSDIDLLILTSSKENRKQMTLAMDRSLGELIMQGIF